MNWNLFDGLLTNASLWVLAWLIAAFILGWLFWWLISSRKIAGWKAKWEALDGEHKVLNKKYGKLSEEHDLQGADLQRLRLDLDAKGKKIHHLEEEKGQLHGDLYGAKDAIEKLEAEKLELSANVGDVGANMGTDGRYAALNAKYNTALKEIDSLRSKMNGMSESNAQLKADLDACQSSKNAGAMASGAPADSDMSADDKAEKAKADLQAAFGTKLAAATADNKDDLKRINGVGPFIEKKLNGIGIYTFEQISQFDSDLIQQVTDAIQFFPGRIQRDDWVGQAKELMNAPAPENDPLGKFKKYKKDDLKIVEGIGPKIAQLLNDGGINSWADLADASVERLQEILDAAGPRYRIHNPKTWSKQADLANKGTWKELDDYQEFLVGGRDDVQ